MRVIGELKERIRRLSRAPELEKLEKKIEEGVSHEGIKEILKEELGIHKNHNKMHLLLEAMAALGLGAGVISLLRGGGSDGGPLYSISRTISLPQGHEGWGSLLRWVPLGVGASAGAAALFSYDVKRLLRRRLKELDRYIQGNISTEEKTRARRLIHGALNGDEKAIEELERNPWLLVIADRILTRKEKDDLVKRLKG